LTLSVVSFYLIKHSKLKKEYAMSVVKVIELLSQSEKGWEAAAQAAIDEASKSVQNIQSIWVKDLQAIVENNKIVNYRLNAKISFVVGKQQ
jgi:dodecin